MKTFSLALALCLTGVAQEKPKQEPAPPVLRSVMECETHQLKTEFEELGRFEFGKGGKRHERLRRGPPPPIPR